VKFQPKLEAKDLSFLDPKLGAQVAKAREQEQLEQIEGYLKGALGTVSSEEGHEAVGAASVEEVMAWMADHASSSVSTARIVSRCVLHTASVERMQVEDVKKIAAALMQSISRWGTLLKKYHVCANAAEQNERQANCLFEVQGYCMAANWPQGLCKMVFYKLYDDDIVFEDAFNIWREDTTETPGKMKALVQVNEFLQWLETAQEDEDGDED